jgi:hypothetical protein
LHGRQKGVDSLLVRDLMTFGRVRAMATAYLITGDEDVREGAAAGAGHGHPVVLLGLPGGYRAFTLLAEADEQLDPPDAFWRPHFTVLTPPTQMEAELPAEPAVPEPASDTAALARPVMAKGDTAVGDASTEGADRFAAAATDAAADVARDWGRTADVERDPPPAALPACLVPPHVDGQSLVVADRELGFVREYSELTEPLRRSFKAELPGSRLPLREGLG